MNNKANIFNFHNNQIRIIEKDGEPWFVAADVCRILEHTNSTIALKPMDKIEKAKLFLGSGAPANIISESGLYKLIMRSSRPEAKEFQNWVTQVVLPAIRKDGAYVQGEEKGRGKWGRHGMALNPHRRPLSGMRYFVRGYLGKSLKSSQ